MDTVRKIRDLFREKEKQAHCSAVIVAAGSSQRMGSDKLTADLCGVPVLVRTLRVFDASPYVDEILVVTRADRIEEMAALCKDYGIGKVSKVLAGGATRVESALVGVSEVQPKASLIAIHDGARPLVSAEVIERTVCAAKEHYAAVPVIPSTDTLKAVDEKGYVVGNIDATILCQRPKLKSFIPGMRCRIAEILKLEEDQVSVKATTEEGLGFTGDGSGIAAHAVVLVQK